MKHKIILYAMLFMAFSNINSLYAESDTLWTTQIGSTVRTVKFSPDGQYVYAAAEGRGPLQLDANNGNIVRRFNGFNYTSFDQGHAIDISPDGKTLVGGDIDNLYFFDTESGELKDSLISPTKGTFYNRFTDVKYTYDSKYLIASVDYDDDFVNTFSYIIVWDLVSKQVIKKINGKENLKLAIDQQNKTLAYIGKQANSENYDIALLEIGTWKEIGVLKGHTSRITDLSFSPDGSLLASCDDKFIKIWELEKNLLKINYKPESITIFSLQLFKNNFITIGNGDVDNYKIRTNELLNNTEIYSIPLIPLDFEYFKNEKIIVANYKSITLINADRLTSVQFNISNDKIYPNPTNNNLIIPKTYFNENFMYFNIIDMSGKEIFRYNNNLITNFNEDLLIDVSRYNKGSYIVQLFYTTNIQTLKFIKE